MSEIESEGEWLVSLDDKAKAVFLATLGHNITVVGRNSYTVQAEGLNKPSQLRMVNEVQHRVLACLRQLLSDQPNTDFQNSIANWVLRQSDSELHELMSWAWRISKESQL